MALSSNESTQLTVHSACVCFHPSPLSLSSTQQSFLHSTNKTNISSPAISHLLKTCGHAHTFHTPHISFLSMQLRQLFLQSEELLTIGNLNTRRTITKKNRQIRTSPYCTQFPSCYSSIRSRDLESVCSIRSRDRKPLYCFTTLTRLHIRLHKNSFLSSPHLQTMTKLLTLFRFGR